MTETPDTSVLVAALATWHPRHGEARSHLGDVATVVGHVLTETFSVLTRLPAPHRITATTASQTLEALPWPTVGLSGERHRRLVAEAGRHAISGGAIYDALIAATVIEHGLRVLTLDLRAARTYRTLGVDHRVL